MTGSRGTIVSTKESSTNPGVWKGTYCFLTSRESHQPIEAANAPRNNPTTAFSTPSHNAPPAAAAAPTVHRGQCATVFFTKRRNKVMAGTILNNFMFSPEPGRVHYIQHQAGE